MYVPLNKGTIGIFHLHPNEFGGNEEMGRARFAFVAAQHNTGEVDIMYAVLPSDLPDDNDAGVGNALGMFKFVNAVAIGSGWNEFEPN